MKNNAGLQSKTTEELITNIQNRMNGHIDVMRETINTETPKIIKAGLDIAKTFENNNRLYIAGNGGSASDSQHLAAEFIGRYKKDREPFPALSLNTDTSILTCISNDYSYSEVFSRQLKALANSGDVFLALSTSGSSKNIISAIQQAKDMKITTIALLGNDGGPSIDMVDLPILVKSNDTGIIQEVHIAICHMICEICEDVLKNG